MQDYKAATLVGTTSFGKGIVQSILPLSDGTAVKLTVSRYFTPKGVCIHGTGVTPDMEVELDEHLESKHKGLYVIGDGSGITHSLSHASAGGVYVAREIARA